MFHKLKIAFLSSFHSLIVLCCDVFPAAFLNFLFFSVTFPINKFHIIPCRGMACGFQMLWKASFFFFIFSQFFFIILMFFHSFVQFSTCFTCTHFQLIVKIFFINHLWSFYFILFFRSYLPSYVFYFCKDCCKHMFACNPF